MTPTTVPRPSGAEPQPAARPFGRPARRPALDGDPPRERGASARGAATAGAAAAGGHELARLLSGMRGVERAIASATVPGDIVMMAAALHAERCLTAGNRRAQTGAPAPENT